MLKLIQGGRSPQDTTSDVYDVDLIKMEGMRRLKHHGFDRYEARERLTGIPTPATLKNYGLQVEFAVRMLSQLNPLPDDFADDGYWPTLESGPPR